MNKLGWKIKKEKDSCKIERNTKETDISLNYFYDDSIDGYRIKIEGIGDFEHHLIEDIMLVINKLAELKGINHQIK